MAWRGFRTSSLSTLVIPSIAVLILLVGAFWAVRIRNIQRLKREVVQLEGKLAAGQEVWRNYPPLTPAEKRDLRRAQERLFRVLPKDKDIPPLFEEITRLAREYKLVDLSFNTSDGALAPGASTATAPGGAAPQVVATKPALSVSPAAQESSGPIASFPIRVTFAGDYRETASFLEALKRFPRLVTIQSVTIQRGIPLLQAEVVLHAYYQKGDLSVTEKK